MSSAPRPSRLRIGRTSGRAGSSAGARHAPTAERGKDTTLAEIEKTFLVMTGADGAFELLADPVRLPDYVPTLRLEDSTAVEGELDVDADLAERDGAPTAGYTADRATRRIEWGVPSPGYGGSIEVTESTTNTSRVTLRLHTREEGEATEVARVVDESVASIRRLLSGR